MSTDNPNATPNTNDDTPRRSRWRALKIILLVIAIIWIGGLAYEAVTGQLGGKTEAPHRVGNCIKAGDRLVC